MIITSLLVTFDIYAECVKNVPYPSMERLLTERFATIDIVIFIPFVGKFLKGYLFGLVYGLYNPCKAICLVNCHSQLVPSIDSFMQNFYNRIIRHLLAPILSSILLNF